MLDQAHLKLAYQIMANEFKMPHVLVSAIDMFMQRSSAAGLF